MENINYFPTEFSKGNKNMNNLIINGRQDFMGKEIPVVLGGFGEGKKCICDKTIAEIHDMGAFKVRERISSNISRFKENIDFIDLKQRILETDTSENQRACEINTLELLQELGYAKQSITQAEHIYLLSERGYAKLIKIMDTDLAWEIHDRLADELWGNNMNEVKNEKDMRTPIEIALNIDKDGMTTAKKLYEFLELNLKNYSHWCKRNITENEFAEENVDYWAFVLNDEWGGQATTDYKLTAHFAKKLSCKGNGERAEQAREYFTTLEERVKQKVIDLTQLSPELQRAYAIIESQAKMELEQKRQAQQITQMENDIKRLEAKVTTHNDEYFTIAGYASLRGLNVDINKANMLGRKASKLSREYGYDISKTKDTRFGMVNTYHTDILKEVFKK